MTRLSALRASSIETKGRITDSGALGLRLQKLVFDVVERAVNFVNRQSSFQASFERYGRTTESTPLSDKAREERRSSFSLPTKMMGVFFLSENSHNLLHRSAPSILATGKSISTTSIGWARMCSIATEGSSKVLKRNPCNRRALLAAVRKKRSWSTITAANSVAGGSRLLTSFSARDASASMAVPIVRTLEWV